MKSKTAKLIMLLLAFALLITGCQPSSSEDEKVNNKTNHYKPYAQVKNIESGIVWPEGQALPTFATPASTLDMILIQNLSADEQITFSALQGIVNKTKPRIYLLDSGADEGALTWQKTFDLEIKSYRRNERFDLVKNYADEIKGVVLYDPKPNPHYRNLASTVAGLKEAIPVTQKIYEDLQNAGINLDVVVDLTELTYTKENEIYDHMYDTYWKDCEKKVLISADPNKDFSRTRDLAAAVGAAVVFPNTSSNAGKDVLRKFLKDMPTGNAIILGWYTTERSGVTTATEFGIGTLPADFYISSTVYSGMDHKIQIPPVPLRKPLENKVYIAFFVSDGDNIQYMQRAMRKIWDANERNRGKIAINWTISPSMVDVGPGLLNYYYTSATDKECFVTGPSGMGYIMPINTNNESGSGAPIGNFLTEEKYADGYTSLTETYLQRSGIRVITIWDNASPMVRASYEKNIRNLYGATVQDFGGIGSVASSIENNRVHFEKLLSAYAGNVDHIRNTINNSIAKWDGNSPIFLAFQADIWSVTPDMLIKLGEDLYKQYPDKIEVVRADHYFNLLNEAKGIPHNLCMLETTKVSTSNSIENADIIRDGTPVTVWEDSSSQEKWVTFDFGDSYNIYRYVIRHAGESGMSQENNTSDYRVLVSTDGENWNTIDTYKKNKDNVTDIEFDTVAARYVKIIIDKAGADGTARIADVEIYGNN